VLGYACPVSEIGANLCGRRLPAVEDGLIFCSAFVGFSSQQRAWLFGACIADRTGYLSQIACMQHLGRHRFYAHFQLHFPLFVAMKKLALPFLIVATLLLSAFATYNASHWKIAEGYTIKFTSQNPSGVFTALKGDIVFDAENLDHARFDVSVDVNSINTGNGLQNKHAKSDKWFDAEKYPDIKFKSAAVKTTMVGFEAAGVLEMHGIKKDFTMPFTFENNTFTSSFEVSRMDFKIGTTEGLSAKVPELLKIDISVPVTR
jgi:polyisoprenoid-binding protein YceI